MRSILLPPSLTTIHQNIEVIAATAVTSLLGIMNKSIASEGDKNILIPVELITRESTIQL